ncbi:HAD-IA family hydrolase [Rhodopirellula sp. MGV]|uniref:HAD-IA family hydrolase n=1 Tax=Rhodopirellula sp. MGV TaxID=2023130 RepID=UPI000B962A4C|nr:HAD-IA family hydrolase [Rhodopirellula sp. MGV]OYP36115.1 hypothetical protein CGZ80_10275 [Rhodopirellula sp. MGV]PNY36526.1 haloacid dehalogenase [Rhodopirellula baltica]
MLPFDWIVFDSTGTLMRPEPDAAAVYHQFGSRLGIQVDIAEIRHRLKAAMVTHFLGENSNLPTDDATELNRWRRIVADTLPEIAEDRFDETFQSLWQCFAEPAAWALFDDVLPTVQRLKQKGYQVAIASNFDERLPPIVEALGLSPSIDEILISSKLGFSKPNLQFYHRAADQLQATDTARLLMIGDTYGGDVEAAQQAGWRARHLVRDCDNALTKLAADL